MAVFFPLDSLLAGIPQKVKFTVTTGHYTVKHGDSLQLSNVEAMLILCHEESRAVIYSNMRGKAAVTWSRWTLDVVMHREDTRSLSSPPSSGGI